VGSDACEGVAENALKQPCKRRESSAEPENEPAKVTQGWPQGQYDY
jgi:hypothetical protein